MVKYVLWSIWKWIAIEAREQNWGNLAFGPPWIRLCRTAQNKQNNTWDVADIQNKQLICVLDFFILMFNLRFFKWILQKCWGTAMVRSMFSSRFKLLFRYSKSHTYSTCIGKENENQIYLHSTLNKMT